MLHWFRSEPVTSNCPVRKACHHDLICRKELVRCGLVRFSPSPFHCVYFPRFRAGQSTALLCCHRPTPSPITDFPPPASFQRRRPVLPPTGPSGKSLSPPLA